jgi:hypothetical protein
MRRQRGKFALHVEQIVEEGVLESVLGERGTIVFVRLFDANGIFERSKRTGHGSPTIVVGGRGCQRPANAGDGAIIVRSGIGVGSRSRCRMTR